MGEIETPAPPEGVLLAGHFVERLGYVGKRGAGTRDWLIFYTCAGEGRFILNDLVSRCHAGEIVLLAPGVPHDYAATDAVQAWDFYWAHFLPRPSWSTWLQLPQSRPGFYQLPVAESPTRQRIQQGWERLLHDSYVPGMYQEELALNALEEILILLRQCALRTTVPAFDPRVEIVLQRLARRLSQPPSVAELAELVALSPSRLAHLFKEQTGDSLAATLLKLRLRHAARLLEFTGLQAREIAQQTGFQSPFHFSRQFKLYYGASPTAYREQRTRIAADNTSRPDDPPLS